MFNKLLIVTMLIASTQSFAGQDGNGGFGIQCGNKIEVLDLYEARTRYNYTVDLGAPDLSVDQKVEKMLQRLRKIGGDTHNLYRMRYQKFWQRAKILKGQTVVKNDDIIVGSNLVYKSDIGAAILPEDCSLIPLARNLTSQNNDLKENIFFLAKFWNRLDNDNKAALIMHELIYFDYVSGYLAQSHRGIQFDAERGSSPVRQTIAFLSSKEADKATNRDVLEALTRKVKRKYTEGDAYAPVLFNFIINEMKISEFTSILFAPNNNDFKQISGAGGIFGRLLYEGKTYDYKGAGGLDFLENNLPKNFWTTYFTFTSDNLNYVAKDGYLQPSARSLDSSLYAIDATMHPNYIPVEVSLYKNGKVKRIRALTVSMPPAIKKLFDAKKLQYHRATFEPQYENRLLGLEFYPNGQVRCASFLDLLSIELEGKWFSRRAQEVQVDLNGNIIAAFCYPNKNEEN